MGLRFVLILADQFDLYLKTKLPHTNETKDENIRSLIKANY